MRAKPTAALEGLLNFKPLPLFIETSVRATSIHQHLRSPILAMSESDLLSLNNTPKLICLEYLLPRTLNSIGSFQLGTMEIVATMAG